MYFFKVLQFICIQITWNNRLFSNNLQPSMRTTQLVRVNLTQKTFNFSWVALVSQSEDSVIEQYKERTHLDAIWENFPMIEWSSWISVLKKICRAKIKDVVSESRCKCNHGFKQFWTFYWHYMVRPSCSLESWKANSTCNHMVPKMWYIHNTISLITSYQKSI